MSTFMKRNIILLVGIFISNSILCDDIDVDIESNCDHTVYKFTAEELEWTIAELIEKRQPLYIFLIRNTDFKPILLEDMRIFFNPIECYIAIDRDTDNDIGMIWHINYLLGHLSEATARQQAAETAFLLHSKMKNMFQTTIHRKGGLFNDFVPLGEVHRYFEYTARHQNTNTCDLYLLSGNQYVTSTMKLACDQHRNPSVSASGAYYPNPTAGSSIDTIRKWVQDFTSRRWDFKLENTYGLRRDSNYFRTNITGCQRRYCLVLRVTQPQIQIHYACGGITNQNTKNAARKLTEELSTGLNDCKIPYNSIQEAYSAFGRILGGSTLYHEQVSQNAATVEGRITPIYKISEERLAKEMGQPITYNQLESHFCYLMDTKSIGGIFLWIGNDADLKTIRKAARCVEYYFNENRVDSHTRVTIMEQKKESIDFKINFPDWHIEFS